MCYASTRSSRSIGIEKQPATGRAAGYRWSSQPQAEQPVTGGAASRRQSSRRVWTCMEQRTGEKDGDSDWICGEN